MFIKDLGVIIRKYTLIDINNNKLLNVLNPKLLMYFILGRYIKYNFYILNNL